ncbi:hypothetical protein HRG_011356 [Hirsutella rhossiliensis]|uniref:Uncharacterized protein n=1 Tax=Hirsutella rhossiliensis TaxID=111463 RepID=A0A9P8SD49_9HYPO|nr:uncharacterized protein HRG_11356 [Hirsutella rhossiliensis]KAH0957574.1 hypothetical protein HRG_11356 [Hirsutella rhossiliensis]
MPDSPEHSAGEPPRGDEHAHFLWVSQGDREPIRELASHGNFDEHYESTFNKVAAVTEYYCRDGKCTLMFEPRLHDLWYAYYKGGRHIPHSKPVQNRLALSLVQIRGPGPLTRPNPGNVSF